MAGSSKRLMIICLLLATQWARAGEYDADLSAKRYDRVEREADAALTVNPHDPDALYAKVEALLVMAPDSRLDEAGRLAAQCLADNPKQSRCHEAYGDVIGTRALNASVFSAMSYATKIRDAYRAAIELDPDNLSVRFSLQQYLLSAPAFLGGGAEAARSLEADTARLRPDAGKLMQAMILLNDGATDKTEALLDTLAPSDSYVLADQENELFWELGLRYLKDRKFADAERAFRALENRYPRSERGPFGLAQVLQEEGKLGDALPLFEQALRIEARADIYYRMGQVLQASKANARAVTAYEMALGARPALGQKQRADAETQLKNLKI
jgi:tetratricopeptide (TPR) repeat protein